MRYCRTLTIRFTDDEERHCYGIDMLDDTGAVRASAPDLTGDWRLITRYVLLMNELQLSPVHFWDVVEDIRYDKVQHI